MSRQAESNEGKMSSILKTKLNEIVAEEGNKDSRATLIMVF